MNNSVWIRSNSNIFAENFNELWGEYGIVIYTGCSGECPSFSIMMVA
jgi:hypothetical protein